MVFPTRAGDTAYGAKTKPVFPAHGGIPRCRTPLETPRPSSKIFPMRKEHHNVQLTEKQPQDIAIRRKMVYTMIISPPGDTD